MFYFRNLALCASIITMAGCATASKDISSTYVSPMQYQSYDCEQLATESKRIESRVSQLGGRLDQAAAHDKEIAGVGMVLFWPALFALGGTKEQEAEYARLKGEYDATQQAAIGKKCPGAIAPVQSAEAKSKDKEAPLQAAAATPKVNTEKH